MGSAISCTECPGAEYGTVINLSNALVLKVADGIEIKPKKDQTFHSIADKEWITRIRCIDDAHSAAYGLNYETILQAILTVERLVEAQMFHEYCPKEALRSCLKLHKGCTLKCIKEVQDFINCIDKVRYEKLEIAVNDMKRKEQSEKRKRIRENFHSK